MTYFNDVEDQPMPQMLIALSWQEVKRGLPMTRETLSFIEGKREGGGPVHLTLQVTMAHRILSSAAATGGALRSSETLLSSSGCNWTIQRDPWCACLRTFGYADVEIFEIDVASLGRDENLSAALACVRAAATCFDVGDTKGTLARCYEAFESAAKYEGAGKKVKGFELLFDRAFPESPEKCAALDKIWQAPSAYSQFGRHAGYPALHVSREEAQFIVRTTLGLFGMITKLVGHDRR